MEKRVFSILKKILIVAIIFTTIGIAMPKKAKADVLNDFISLVLRIPDGAMSIIDTIMANSNEFTMEQLDFKGWDHAGYLYNFQVTPYAIFSSGIYEEVSPGVYHTKMGYLDINFFSDKKIVSGDNNSTEHVSSTILAPVIGNIYKKLRNFCMVLMMLVIMYIGIKIMISSIAEQQAKYKRALVDWAVGFSLLFLMHYIMSGIVSLNGLVLSILKNDDGDAYYVGIAELEDNGHDSHSTWYDIVSGNSYIKNVSVDMGTNAGTDLAVGAAEYEFKYNRLIVSNSTEETGVYEPDEGGYIDLKATTYAPYGSAVYQQGTLSNYSKWGDNGEIYLAASLWNPKNDLEDLNVLQWMNKWARELDNFITEGTYNKAIVKLNALSYTRTVSSFASSDNESVMLYGNGTSKTADVATTMGYSALYLCLVVETIMFLFIYIKRVLQLAFYTMIAPIVAIMYPLDRLGDGKAQSFNAWVKDYIFNVLIQPMHLLLYLVFITAAGQLISRNIIYAMAIYGFMIPAEKYFKKVLGFEKASTGGGGPLSQAIGRGLAMDALGKFAGIGPAGRGGKGGSSKEGGRKKIKTQKMDAPTNSPISSGGGPNSRGGNPLSAGGQPIGGQSAARARGGQNRNPAAAGGSAGQSSRGNGAQGNVSTSRTPNAGPTPASRVSKPKSLARYVGKSISKAVTGGEYDSLTDARTKGKYAWAVTKNLGGHAIRGASRATGAILAGGLGAVAGVATAMATGDASNILKGVTVGAKAGDKIMGNMYDSTTGFFGDFEKEFEQERANENEGNNQYNKDLRIEEARKNLREGLKDVPGNERAAYDNMIEKMAPYVDLNDISDVKALIKCKEKYEQENGANSFKVDEAVKLYNESSKMSVEEHYDEYLKKVMRKNGVREENIDAEMSNKTGIEYQKAAKQAEWVQILQENRKR